MRSDWLRINTGFRLISFLLAGGLSCFAQTAKPAPVASRSAATAATKIAATHKATAHASVCTIKPVNYDGWKAEEMSNPWVKLEIVPQIGGRLMQVTFGGHDFLYINQQQQGKVLALDSKERAGNYGGDKIWPLPEGTQDEQHWGQGGLQPLDYGPYKFQVLSRGSKCSVRMTGLANPNTTGQRYIREISIGTDTPVITFQSTMQNMSGFPQTWSEQTISEYPTTTDAAGTVPNDKLWSVTEMNPKSAYPKGYQIATGRQENPAYVVSDGNLRVHWNNISQEVWIDTPTGWLASVDGTTGYTMVERHTIDPHMEYPGKATIIFYSAGGRGGGNRPGQPAAQNQPPAPPGPFIEEEVNSPMVSLAPGESYTMETTWYPTRMGEDFKTTTYSGVVGTPLTASATPAGLVLSGNFGVFYAGTLVAHFYARGGQLAGTATVATVTPLEPVVLQTTVQAPQGTSRVSLHLVDPSGQDRGPLGEVLVNPPPAGGGRGRGGQQSGGGQQPGSGGGQ